VEEEGRITAQSGFDMAKVKDQIYDGSEETYTDAGGVIHFFGELFRHIMPDSYPLPSLNPTGVTRKSPRGYKPSQQGPGSAAQRPWRECFVLCAERWDELPDECPEIPPCPARPSKDSVWMAKQAQGVMCSYYDLYMDCCLSSCVEISIEGPDGVSYTGGSIPDVDDCWPCVPPCLESTLSISHTTTRMQVGESQQLTAHDSLFGDEVPCCPTGDLSWEIIVGGGILEPDSGQSVLYIAPETNDGCTENPTIEVTDCCGRTAQLKLAVNQYSNTVPPNTAVFVGECTTSQEVTQAEACANPECPGYPSCICYDKTASLYAKVYAYFCDGTPVGAGVECGDKDCGACGTSAGCVCDDVPLSPPCSCDEAFTQVSSKCRPESEVADCPACGYDGCAVDVRTAAMIADGCCPPEIL